MDARSLEKPDPTRAAHDQETPEALVAFMSRDWIPRDVDRSAHPQLARLRERREALSRAFAAEVLLIPAGIEHVRANDTFFRFRPASDFAYLMGGGERGGLLVFEPHGGGHRTRLFVPEHNRGSAEAFTDRVHGELWVGSHRGVDESQAYYGVDFCESLKAIDAYVEELRRSRTQARLLRGVHPAIDAKLDKSDADDELATYLAEMRLCKDEYEIAELRKAVQITKRGFEDALAVLSNAHSEREIEAAFWRRARIEANDVGYLTIAASGDNACTLHWNRNSGRLERGSLLLLDAGVECDSLYTADVTRTLPVGGRFSPEQRAVYQLVYEAQAAGIEACTPGNDFLEPNRRAMKVLSQGLIDLKVLHCSLDEALDPQKQYYRRYTLHGVSHMLGIDVHDCARARSEEYRQGTLKTGMALTVEPGLYFQRDDATVPQALRGIGVRIEDDVVITSGAPDVLSSILPSSANAVEEWVKERSG